MLFVKKIAQLPDAYYSVHKRENTVVAFGSCHNDHGHFHKFYVVSILYCNYLDTPFLFLLLILIELQIFRQLVMWNVLPLIFLSGLNDVNFIGK